MKANRNRRRRRVFPAPQPSRSGSTDVESVLDEHQLSNRTGFQFLGAAAPLRWPGGWPLLCIAYRFLHDGQTARGICRQ